MAKQYFSKEQIQVANQVDLVRYLQDQGETLIKAGKDMRWERYSSVTIRGNRYYRWKTQEGGYPIQFLKEFYGYSFKEAMELLLSYASEQGQLVDVKPKEVEKKPFHLPEKNGTMRRIYGYLLRERCIDKDILDAFVRMNMIYEDKRFHNVIFVGFDENGVPKHAHRRSTYSEKKYRGNIEGSDPNYSFHFLGKDNSVYVFEAPIDMLSYISMHPENWRDHSYVALNGVITHALEHMLDHSAVEKQVYLCFDHDIAGMEAAERVLDVLHERNITDVTILRPKNKDFNEDLKEQKGIEPLKGEDSPKRTEMRQELYQMKQRIQDYNQDRFNHMESIGTYFARLCYSYQKDGPNNYSLIHENTEILLFKILQKLNDPINNVSPLSPNYKVWSQLEQDYRGYKDTGNIHRLLEEGKEILKQMKDASDPTPHYRSLARTVLNIKLQAKRELVRIEQRHNVLPIPKPDAPIIGADGNVFNLMGICTKALQDAGMSEEATEMNERIIHSNSYQEALAIMSDYVNPVDVEPAQDYDMAIVGYQ